MQVPDERDSVPDYSIYIDGTWDPLTTLRAYDETRYRFGGGDPLLAPEGELKPYRGSLFLQHAVVDVDGQPRTILLSMAAGYVYAQLCESSSGVLKQFVPYQYVPGRHHGKVEGKYRRWDMRVEAQGKEAIVEELQQRIWAYERLRFDELLTWWDQDSRSCSYFMVTVSSGEPSSHIVLSNKEALGQVRMRSLLEDCERIREPAKALARQVKREKRLLERFVGAQHAEVAKTHGGNVKRLRERYRISARVPWPLRGKKGPKGR